MPDFQFHAIDSDDQPIEGTIEAENRYVAVARLLQRGLHVVELSATVEDTQPPVELAANDSSRDVHLSADETLAVTDGMADVVRSGLPLAAGLRALATELPSRSARRALTTISGKLEQGAPLDQAVEGQLALVPRHLQVLLKAGVQTGRLDILLEHYLHFARTSLDTRRRSVLAFFYPAMLLTVTMLVAGAMLGLVVPPFRGIFEDFGMTIPDITLCILWLAEAVAGWRMLVFPAVLLVCVAGWILLGQIAGPLQRKWLYYVPALGRLVRLMAVARYCHLLAMGVQHGIPLCESLKLAGDGTHDAYIRQASWRMARDTQQGLPLSQASSRNRMVPEVTHVFEWEGRDDAFAEVLRATGDICAAQARVQSGMVRVLVEPIAVISVAIIVGFVVFALLMPMIKLLNALS